MLNWGNGHAQPWLGPNVRIFNRPDIVAIAANKLKTFERFKEREFENIPEWTINKAEAAQWIEKGHAVVCRTILNGHSGRGIILADTLQQLVVAPLYTKYVKKQKEFRVHVAFNECMDVQEKRRSREVGAEADNRIRNHQRGWVYCREEIVEPEGLRQIASDAIAALGLDFGAVDIIWNKKANRCIVLEVNTACGLEGTTLANYTNLIMEKLK